MLQLASAVLDWSSPDNSQSHNKLLPQDTGLALAMLPAIGTASAMSGERSFFDHLLQQFLSKDLTDQQIDTIALAISHAGTSATTTTVAAKGRQQANTGSDKALIQLWSGVLKRNRQGSDRWLEASLQLAALSAANNDTREATRILNLVDVLYPSWGNPTRQQAAMHLKKQLAAP